MPTEQNGTLSTFGGQVLSTKPTQPRTRIGTAGRQFEGEKQFEYKYRGNTSTGVFTQPASGFGKQNESTNQTAPASTFGNKYRSDNDMLKQSRPGPGQYETVEAVGRQTQSQKPTSSSYKIGTSQRWGQYNKIFKPDFQGPAALNPRPASGWMGDAPTASFYGKGQRADVANGLKGQTPTSSKTPGPGSYEPPLALGAQVDSRKPTSVKSRIGTASREQLRKTYISPDHEKDRFGIHTPGPGIYNPRMAQTQKATSSFKFGTGDRFSEIKSGNAKVLKNWTPGPGAYVV